MQVRTVTGDGAVSLQTRLQALREGAVRNNAAWCDAVCRAHGAPGEMRAHLWLNRRACPPFYPNLVTLSAGVDRAEVLRALAELAARDPAALPPGWGVKDSHGELDLSGVGFGLLFEGQWLHSTAPPLPLPALGPAPDAADLCWTRVDTAAALAAWEAAWAGDAGNAGLPAGHRQFPPALLRAPGVAFVAGHRHGRVVAGGAVMDAEGVAGVSNVFLPAADPQSTQACRVALLAFVRAAISRQPAVGYESGDALAQALAWGDEALGPLRVWVRSAPRPEAITSSGSTCPGP